MMNAFREIDAVDEFDYDENDDGAALRLKSTKL